MRKMLNLWLVFGAFLLNFAWVENMFAKNLSIENNMSCDCGDFKSQDEINKFFGVKSSEKSIKNSSSNLGENLDKKSKK